MKKKLYFLGLIATIIFTDVSASPNHATLEIKTSYNGIVLDFDDNYYTAVVTFPAGYDNNIEVTTNSYSISLTGQIDEVWFRPADAQMSTYTYNPLMGMTYSMDAKGISTYYEYDGFQRLKYIKDQDGDIVKQYDYHYKPQGVQL